MTAKLNNYDFVFRLLTLILVACSLAGVAAPFHWFFDLFDHFRLHYLLGFLILSLILVSRRQMAYASIAIVGVTFNIRSVIHIYQPVQPPAINVVNEGPTVKLLQWNMLAGNHQFDQGMSFLIEQDPDIIALQELTHPWLPHLGALESKYPFRKMIPTSDPMGIALLSKFPMENTRVLYMEENNELPFIESKIMIENQPIKILNIHAKPAIGNDFALSRLQQFKGIKSWHKSQEIPAVITGDFNATPWSQAMKTITSDSNMVHASQGLGFQWTWPANLWLPFLNIPIDHTLYNKQRFKVVHRQMGPNLGSDHKPIVTTLQLILPQST